MAAASTIVQFSGTIFPKILALFAEYDIILLKERWQYAFPVADRHSGYRNHSFYPRIAKRKAQYERAEVLRPIQPSVEYLHQHYCHEDITNAFLAQISGVSEVYFRKRFRLRFGISPHQYLLNLRIQRAKQLLAEGELNVSEIADNCGFSSVYHFSRTFKAHVGTTPTQYAMQSRQDLI